jgi:hypothetical protein
MRSSSGLKRKANGEWRSFSYFHGRTHGTRPGRSNTAGTGPKIASAGALVLATDPWGHRTSPRLLPEDCATTRFGLDWESGLEWRMTGHAPNDGIFICSDESNTGPIDIMETAM